MKILQVCSKPPFPPYDGGSIAMNNITDGLLEDGHQLKLVSVSTHKHFVDINDLPDEYRRKTNIEFIHIDTKIRPLKALYNLLFSRRSYNIIRFEIKSFENRLAEILKSEDFDLVIIESVFLKHYVKIIRKTSNAKIILRAHNIEFMIWQRLALEEDSWLRKIYLSTLSKRLKKEELSALEEFDAIITVSESDMQSFQKLACTKPMESIPISIDVTKDLAFNSDDVEYPSVFFIGALDWLPNQEGINWFLTQVWPELNKLYPDLKFFIAGRGEAAWLKIPNNQNIVFLGEIEDAASYFKSKAIMIVPLFSGSGMRVKIIEGMTFGKAIVSTTIGVEGIEHKHQENIIIADSKEDYIQSIQELIVDKNHYDSICKSASNHAIERYSNKAITEKLIRFIGSLK